MQKLSTDIKSILKIIETLGPIRSSEIIKKTNLSGKSVYKHLARLVDLNLIKKNGVTPKVYYTMSDKQELKNKALNSFNIDDLVLEYNYAYVSPTGQIVRGLDGFRVWCSKNKFDFEKEKSLLIKRLKEVNKIKKNGLISAKQIILSGKVNLSIDNIFFSDFYTLDHFGKTKLGQLVYVGKSSQNKELIKEIANIVKPSILYLIEKYDIQKICFIPPTIDRRVQFMSELNKSLTIDLPELKISKIPSENKIPQKTLKKLEDRIINAASTIAVSPTQQIDGNVLIIDDATGSGATINETAKKIRLIADNKIKIIGYSIVGSYKGFDVISEV